MVHKMMIKNDKIRTKSNNIKFWIIVITMIIADFNSNFLVISGKKNNNTLYIFFGMILYILSGFMYFKLLKYKNILIITSLWSMLTLIGMAVVSSIYFKDKYTLNQKIGFILILFSILILSK